jgi:hypothetical protein
MNIKSKYFNKVEYFCSVSNWISLLFNSSCLLLHLFATTTEIFISPPPFKKSQLAFNFCFKRKSWIYMPIVISLCLTSCSIYQRWAVFSILLIVQVKIQWAILLVVNDKQHKCERVGPIDYLICYTTKLIKTAPELSLRLFLT